MDIVNDLLEWLRALPPDFAFLLAIPFLVAAAGLLADRDPEAPSAAPEPVSGHGRLSHPSHPR
jgi:hypothetical protein